MTIIKDKYGDTIEVHSEIDALSAAIGDNASLDTDLINRAILTNAAADGRTVSFEYAKGDGNTIELRSLVPNEVKEFVVGYDPVRDEPRAYRLDRIKGLVS